jgi:hypothetical protein
MSDIALFSQGGNTLPAHLRNLELDATTKALMGSGGNGKRISIRGNVFRMVVGGKEVAQNDDRAMNVIIVRAAEKVSRSFYAGVYVEGQNAAPSCQSTDGVAPDKGVKNPQSTNCQNCQQNIKGSGQGDSRACRFNQRVALALENNIGGDVYQLTLPGQSIFGTGDNGKMPLQQYAKFLGGHGLPVGTVVTEMRFDTSSATPKLTFRAVRPLSVDELAESKRQSESADALNAVTLTVNQIDGDVPVAKASPFVEPAHTRMAVEAADEPVKRAVKKTETKDVAAVLDAWADDES